MREATGLRLVALAALLWTSGVGLGAQAPDRPIPHAPPTVLRTAPTEAEQSAWRTKLPWMESSDAARTPRMRGRLYHQEYLSRVTPEGFRRSAMGAAPGVGADPGRALHFLADAWRARQARRFGAEVARELALLERRNAGTADEPAR
ncbi:MAG: hypothetical protein AB7I25_07245 [Vicinamibacterales bacterium]